MSRRRAALYALTFVVLAVLVVLPQTGWLVRSQAGAAIFRPTPVFQRLMRGSAGAPDEVARLRAAAAHRPDVFRLQLAAAMTASDDWQQRIDALRPVRDRFPDEPAVHAALLRMYAGNFVHVGHAEEQEALSALRKREETNPRPAHPDPTKNRPGDLADFERTAAAGERLDPDNAFFPFLRAVGLLAADRDAEARAALARAASKRVWNEYIPEGVEAEWDLAVRVAGSEIGALPRTAVWAATLYPHYAAMRAEARLFVARAVRAELAGKPDEGLALRRDVARVGALLRADANIIIGSLLGQAITQTAAVRPGGAPLPPRERVDNGGDRNREKQVAAYCAYLASKGYADEARWFRAEAVAAAGARNVARDAFSDTLVGVHAVDRLLPYWGIGIGLLLNVLLLVAFAGLMTLARRVSPRLREGEPLTPAARWGLSLGLLTPPLALLCAVYGADLPEAAAVVCGVGYLALLAGVPIGGRFGWRGTLGGAALALATAGLLFGAAYYIAVQAKSAMQPFQMLQGIAAFGDDGTSVGFGDAMTLLLSMTALLFCGAVPLLLLLTLTALSRPLRIPASHAVARGFEALAGPLACLLLLGYAGLAVATARQEARARESLSASVRHEGRYHAERLGKEWPGLVGTQAHP